MNIRFKNTVAFPAKVQGAGVVAVNKANGVWTVKLDFTQLSDIVPTSDHLDATQIFYYDPLAAQYGLISLSELATIAQTGVLAAGISTFLATPTSANLAAALTDETGTGSAVFANAPALINPDVGTQTPGDNTTKAASTAFVTAAVVSSTSGVSSLNGQTGALTLLTGPQGRLSLTAGTAVPVSDVAAATTIYYVPAAGFQVPIYNGTVFIPTVLGTSDLSNVTTASSTGKAGPSAVTTNSNYDLFVWNDSGTKRLSRGPAWTSDTARGTGAGTTELVLQRDTVGNAFLVNKISITNGPGASAGTYVGTVRSNGTSTIDMTFGTSAAGGGMATLGVWNLYNQVYTQACVKDSTTNWSYSSATYRNANGSATNRVNFIQGLQQGAIYAAYMQTQVNLINAALANVGVGWSLDGVSIPNYSAIYFSSTGLAGGNTVSGTLPPQLGFHRIQAVERSDGTNANQFLGGVFQSLNYADMR